MKKAVVLLSGGMDSVTLLHYVKQKLNVEELYALSFVYGQKHVCELEMARWQASAAGVLVHRVIDISFFGEMIHGSSALTDVDLAVPDLDSVDEEHLDQPITYVPHRNLVMLSLTASYAEALGATDIFYGAQAQDEYGYWDCTSEFVEKLNVVLDLNRLDAVTVHAPFTEKSKTDIVKIGMELGVDYDHTWSCYRGGDKPCGTCPSCVEREKAFSSADSAD